MAEKDIEPISSGPLVRRIGNERGSLARFAGAIGVSAQRLSNWRTRGIPPRELPKVAAQLGLTVEQYLDESGQPVHVAHQPEMAYLTDPEKQLLDDYRRASPRWQLTLRLLAKLRTDPTQEEVAESVNAVLAKIAADPVPDSRLSPAWTRPDRRR